MTTIDLKSKFEELETRRKADVQALDETIDAIRTLLDLDKHLVKLGLQPEHQLRHAEAFPVEAVHDYLGVTLSIEEEAPAVEAKRRRYSDEEKAEAVRLADELGSDEAARKQLGISMGSIGNWRKAGHGKKPKSVTTPRPVADSAEHEGPKTKCSICKAKVPVVGEVNEVNRVTALREHYKESPDCSDALRRRHG